MVNRALLLTFTTVLGVNPPPFTVSVNAGPPVATMDGEIEVISTPVPVRLGFGVVTATEAVTLSWAVSLPTRDGVKLRLVSQPLSAFNWNGGAGQADSPSPLATNATLWKSAAFVPVIPKAEVTIIADEDPFSNVAFIVALVPPMTTGPKFTGVKSKAPPATVKGMPVMGMACGLPVPSSVRFSVATLFAFPGGVAAV